MATGKYSLLSLQVREKVRPQFLLEEPYASLLRGPRKVFWHEAPKIVGLSEKQIVSLQEAGLFPLGKCDPVTSRVSFYLMKLVAYRWSLHQKNWHSEAVDYWLGRDRED